jgi:hypothetical protein
MHRDRPLRRACPRASLSATCELPAVTAGLSDSRCRDHANARATGLRRPDPKQKAGRRRGSAAGGSRSIVNATVRGPATNADLAGSGARVRGAPPVHAPRLRLRAAGRCSHVKAAVQSVATHGKRQRWVVRRVACYRRLTDEDAAGSPPSLRDCECDKQRRPDDVPLARVVPLTQ